MFNLISLVIWFIACTAQDLYQRQISNFLTLGAVSLALVYLACTGHTWLGASAAEGGWALLIVLILTLPGYALNKFGAGDVKLLSALALATDRLMVCSGDTNRRRPMGRHRLADCVKNSPFNESST